MALALQIRKKMTATAPLPATQQLQTTSLVFSTLFAASLLGILTRPLGHLAAFWPANALFVGLMLRFPSLATPLAWLGGAVGYVAADMATGSTLPKTLLLTAGNLVGVVTGYLLFCRLHADDLHMRRPISVSWMVLVTMAASAVAGVIGAIADPLLFGGDPWQGWTFWFVTELVNYLAILPMVLTLPDRSWRSTDRRHSSVSARKRIGRMVPALAFGASCVVSDFIGGPGALMVPIPALLWCALYYSVFTTAVLTVVFSAWALLALSMGNISFPIADMNSRSMLLSIRIGVALVSLAPITVACVMESRNQLLKEFERLASQDQLSGLLNRRAFYERAASLLAQIGTQNYPAAVLMLDIDRFKAINDTLGHAGGDQVLIAFSRLASSCFRESDVFGRIGGEEFAAVLPDCSADSGKAIAERLRRTFAEASIEVGTDHAISATVSIGMATIAQGPGKIEALLLVADKALYRAKERGRNRVEYEELDSLHL